MTTVFNSWNEPLLVRYPELAGRVAVVTGASGGIGQAFARGLSGQGVHVIAGDLSEAGLKDLEAYSATEADHGQITPVVANIADQGDNQRLVSTALDRHGHLDFFVAAAAIYPRGLAIDLSPSQLRTALEINVEGQFYGAQAAARAMKPGSAIVTLSSAMATRAGRQRAAYSVTKAAVAHLTRALALEFAELGIRVNSIAPGFIDTPMTHWVKDDQAVFAATLDRVPLGRVGSPVEVLGVLLFLLSHSARYVTGHSLAVDGGASLT